MEEGGGFGPRHLNMAATWEVFIGDLQEQSSSIFVPAECRYWPDGLDPQANPPARTWDVSHTITPQQWAGQTVNQVKQAVAALIAEHADIIKDGVELWEAVKDLGNQPLPNWP